MKNFLIIVSLMILVGCSTTQNKQEDPRIKQFEDAFGAENSEALNDLVSTFELFLQYNYPDRKIEDAYDQYLELVATKYWTDYGLEKTFSEERQERTCELYQSVLRNSLYWTPSNVRIEGDTLFTYYIYIEEGDTLENMSVQWLDTDLTNSQIDSIKAEALHSIWFNKFGRYLTSIEKIKEDDEFLKAYFDNKMAMGTYSPAILVGQIKMHEPDYTDYFLKRVIAIELYHPCME
jgi:hypothetical protein